MSRKTWPLEIAILAIFLPCLLSSSLPRAAQRGDGRENRLLFCESDTIRYRYGVDWNGSFPLSEVSSPDTSRLPVRQPIVFYADGESLAVEPADGPIQVLFASPSDTVVEVILFASDCRKLLREHAAFGALETNAIAAFTYASADDENLRVLRETYRLDEIAGERSEEERIINLMRWGHGIVRHDGNSTNPEPRNALNLIDVCRREDRGVNCRMMATILNEAYLAMGFRSRHITCLPFDKNDNDCHVVTLVFADSVGRWFMMDSTFEAYLIDHDGKILDLQTAREALIAGDEPAVNPEINWNGTARDPAEYLQYLSKNLFRFSCPVSSEFGYESKAGRRSWVTLNPLGYDQDKLAEPDSTGSYVINFYTHDADRFWAAPGD